MKKMQQWWFDDGLGLKSVFLLCFYDFSLIFKVFINIHEYANYSLHLRLWDKGICLTFNLVPRLVVYDKYQLRYD